MLRRTFVSALPLLLAASRAGAAAGGGSGHELGQFIDLQPMGLPVVVDGRLVNYVFVFVRLNLASGADTAHWREKEPFFRDALVRAAHQTPFTVKGDCRKIDTAKLTSTMLRAAGAIAGSGVIRSVVVTTEAPSRRGRSRD